MGWLRDLWATEASRYVSGFLGNAQQVIVPDEEYIYIDVETLWVTHVRKGWNKFYAAIYGQIALQHELGVAQYQIFDALGNKEYDAKHLDRVIQGPFSLVNGVPYRSGDIQLDLGLFSIQSANLIAPYLGLLQDISKFAMGTFLPQVMEVVQTVEKSLQAITGGDSLEIGRVGKLEARTGRYLIIRADAAEYNINNFKYDDQRRLLYYGNEVVENFPYAIIQIRSKKERDGFYDIPAIRDAFQHFKNQIRKHPFDRLENAKAFEQFRVMCELSPDLLMMHAQKLVAQIRERYANYLPKPEDAAFKGQQKKASGFLNVNPDTFVDRPMPLSGSTSYSEVVPQADDASLDRGVHVDALDLELSSFNPFTE